MQKFTGRDNKPNREPSNSVHEQKRPDSELEKDIQAGLDKMRPSKDDLEAENLKEKQEYNDKNYWAVDNQYSLDDLLAEQDDHDFPDFNPKPWGGAGDDADSDDKEKADDKDEEVKDE